MSQQWVQVSVAAELRSAPQPQGAPQQWPFPALILQPSSRFRCYQSQQCQTQPPAPLQQFPFIQQLQWQALPVAVCGWQANQHRQLPPGAVAPEPAAVAAAPAAVAAGPATEAASALLATWPKSSQPCRPHKKDAPIAWHVWHHPLYRSIKSGSHRLLGNSICTIDLALQERLCHQCQTRTYQGKGVCTNTY